MHSYYGSETEAVDEILINEVENAIPYLASATIAREKLEHERTLEDWKAMFYDEQQGRILAGEGITLAIRERETLKRAVIQLVAKSNEAQSLLSFVSNLIDAVLQLETTSSVDLLLLVLRDKLKSACWSMPSRHSVGAKAYNICYGDDQDTEIPF